MLCFLLLFLFYTVTKPMDRQLEPWEQQEFWDLADNENHRNAQTLRQEQEDRQFTKYQNYLNEKPLFCPLSRRSCLLATWWTGVFLPPIVASQHALQVQLTSLPLYSYAIAAGVTSIWTAYEIKKLAELVRNETPENDEDDIFEELY